MMAEAATFPELTRFYYEEVVTRGHRLMAGVIERGIKSGEFRPVDVKVAAKLAMTPLMHAVIARRAFASCMPEGFDVKQYLDTHIDLYLHGIAKQDRKSTRLNSSHGYISYAVFCLKKKKKK